MQSVHVSYFGGCHAYACSLSLICGAWVVQVLGFHLTFGAVQEYLVLCKACEHIILSLLPVGVQGRKGHAYCFWVCAEHANTVHVGHGSSVLCLTLALRCILYRILTPHGCAFWHRHAKLLRTCLGGNPSVFTTLTAAWVQFCAGLVE